MLLLENSIIAGLAQHETVQKKSHTCEEGEVQLRIFVWHLLANLKNNYLLKKLLKWTNRKYKNFIFFLMFYLKKKHLEILLFYTCAPKNLTK